MRLFACALSLLFTTCAWGQSPPTPSGSPPKSTPQAQPPTQPPTTQLYRLVPVDQPTTQTVQVQQQPQYQTVQLVQQPVQQQYQTVQVQQQAVQQVQYVNATQSTFAMSSTGSHTVVLGPGPLALSAAWVGQRMAGLGKTHVWNISHKIIRPQPQPGPPVTQLVSVSMPQPIVQQPVTVQYVQQPLQQPSLQQYRINAPSEDAPPPPVVPTPQSSTKIPPPKHHSLFGMLGN